MTLMAARAELRGFSGNACPLILKLKLPKSPDDCISWIFSVILGSAISCTQVASKPTPAEATAAASFAFFG